MIQRDDVEEMVNGLQWDAAFEEIQSSLDVNQATVTLSMMTPRAWEELSQKLSKVFE